MFSFLPRVVTEMRSCSVRVKILVKVGLSVEGCVQLDFFLKGGFFHECFCAKNVVVVC